MVLNVDFAPTLLDAAGRDGAGRHAGPQLPAAARRARRRRTGGRRCTTATTTTRSTTTSQPHYGVRTERYKLIYFNKIDQWELFDLQNDPREMKNVYADPAYAETVKRSKAEL